MNNNEVTREDELMFSWKAVFVLCIFVVQFLLYAETAQSIVLTWQSSPAFAVGYVIAPISALLIWQRRDIFRSIQIRPFWPASPILIILGFAWLLADFAKVQAIQQCIFVGFVPIFLLLFWGRRLTWEMVFPLSFLLFAIPFGAILTSPLIEFAANLTFAALQSWGLTVARNGSYISVPTGSLPLAETFADLSYVFFFIPLCTLFAYLMYQSNLKRMLFIFTSIFALVLALILGVLINIFTPDVNTSRGSIGSIRALSGCLFVGFMILLIFWLGGFKRDTSSANARLLRSSDVETIKPVSTKSLFAVLFFAVFILAIWPIYSTYVASIDDKKSTVALAALHVTWLPTNESIKWRPAYHHAHSTFDEAYQRDWYRVGLSIRYYKNQTKDAHLVSSANGLTPEKDGGWRLLGSAIRGEGSDAGFLRLIETRVQDKAGQNFLVWQTYWVDQTLTVSPLFAQLLQARSKLFLKGDDGAAIFIYARFVENPEEARISMRPFLKSNMQQISDELAGFKSGTSK
ncbi:MAG: EpsI family protein [Burkholderiaceae bacterium]|nr:EpsI family protein [Burkholderiaceae bacterium]